MHGDDCVAHTLTNFSNATDDVALLSCTRVFRVRLVDLAAMPGGPHLIPSRTQSLSPPGPMVLCLKAWESRSLPGLHGACEAKSKEPSITMAASAVTFSAADYSRPFAYLEYEV